MIWKLILPAISALFAGLDLLIPDLELPYLDEAEDAAEWLGSSVGFLQPVLPIDTLATFFAWTVSTYLPCWFVFVVVRWLYAHFPVIGSGG